MNVAVACVSNNKVMADDDERFSFDWSNLDTRCCTRRSFKPITKWIRRDVAVTVMSSISNIFF